MLKHSFPNNLLLAFCLIILLLANCSPLTPSSSSADVVIFETSSDGLSVDEHATLESLRKVDDFPLYTMTYQGDYFNNELTHSNNKERDLNSFPIQSAGWGCSLFSTLVENKPMLYGRNFDWRYSPAMLLFTDPSNGYASVAMVDIGYLVETTRIDTLTESSLDERAVLLEAPFWPFDGMNEVGLVIGMAAVPDREMPNDPDKETIDSLMVMRLILDHAESVDEAVAIIDSYNIDWDGGPALHYLIADRSGEAVLVEFTEGERILIPNEDDWHIATNHLRTEASAGSSGCHRYDLIAERLADNQGMLNPSDALKLLDDVSSGDQESGTQWSILYDISAGVVRIVMGRAYDEVYEFSMGSD